MKIKSSSIHKISVGNKQAYKCVEVTDEKVITNTFATKSLAKGYFKGKKVRIV